MGCIWQPFWILYLTSLFFKKIWIHLANKVSICCHLWIMREINSQSFHWVEIYTVCTNMVNMVRHFYCWCSSWQIKWQIYPLVLASSGQEWQFYISTVRVHIGRSTGRSSGQEWQFYISTVRLQEWQFYISTVRVDIGRSTGRSTPLQIYPPLLPSSGQEWWFHISTVRSHIGRWSSRFHISTVRAHIGRWSGRSSGRSTPPINNRSPETPLHWISFTYRRMHIYPWQWYPSPNQA